MFSTNAASLWSAAPAAHVRIDDTISGAGTQWVRYGLPPHKLKDADWRTPVTHSTWTDSKAVELEIEPTLTANTVNFKAKSCYNILHVYVVSEPYAPATHGIIDVRFGRHVYAHL